MSKAVHASAEAASTQSQKPTKRKAKLPGKPRVKRAKESSDGDIPDMETMQVLLQKVIDFQDRFHTPMTRGGSLKPNSDGRQLSEPFLHIPEDDPAYFNAVKNPIDFTTIMVWIRLCVLLQAANDRRRTC